MSVPFNTMCKASFISKLFASSICHSSWKSEPIEVLINSFSHIFRSLSLSSVAQSCPTLCNPMDCSKTGFPVHRQLTELAQTHVHWAGDPIQPSHPVSSLSPPVLNLPSISVFSNESVLRVRWPKYWSFSFNISPSNEYSGLIDWLGLLAVQGTLKSLLQFKSINFLVFNFLYSPNLTFVHDCWKNHSLDRMDFCWQSNVSAF